MLRNFGLSLVRYVGSLALWLMFLAFLGILFFGPILTAIREAGAD